MFPISRYEACPDEPRTTDSSGRVSAAPSTYPQSARSAICPLLHLLVIAQQYQHTVETRGAFTKIQTSPEQTISFLLD